MVIGRHSYFLGTDHGTNTRIGHFSSIAGGVYIHGADNHAIVSFPNLVTSYDFGIWDADFTPSGIGKGGVNIGNDVWIGEGVQILDGVTIRDGAIIGAHSVIAKDVEPYAVVVGNPYVVKRYRYDRDQIIHLLKIQWWNWDDKFIREHLEDFRDIYTFIEKYKVCV